MDGWRFPNTVSKAVPHNTSMYFMYTLEFKGTWSFNILESMKVGYLSLNEEFLESFMWVIHVVHLQTVIQAPQQ